MTVAQTGKSTFEVEKSIGGLVITGTATGLPASDSLVGDNAWGVIEDTFGLTTIEVVLKPKKGKHTYLIEKMTLKTLLEYIAVTEGALQWIESYVDGLDADYTFHVYIPFTKFGKIPLRQDENISIEVNASSLNCAFEMYGMEYATYSDKVIRISSTSVGEGVKNKTVDVSEFEYILVPFAVLGEGTTFQLNYTNGESPIYSEAEYRAMGNHTNEVLAHVGLATIGGFADHVILECSTIKDVDIRRDGTDAFEIIGIDFDYHANVGLAHEANEKMVNVAKMKRRLRGTKMMETLAKG